MKELLLALAISALVAYSSVLAIRLMRRDGVALRGIQLKLGGSSTAAGRVVFSFLIVLAVFVMVS